MIVIIGAGAIGSLLGYFLQKNGHDVLLIGRKKHCDAIMKKGLKISGIIEETVKIPAATETNEEGDFVFVCTKSYDTEKAIRQFRHVISPSAIVVSVQNGIGNMEILQKYVEGSNLVAGVTYLGALLEKPGKIYWAGKERTIFGNYFTDNLSNAEKVHRLFADGFSVSMNIRQEMYEKFLVNVCMNALGAVAEARNKDLAENEHLRFIIEKTMNETKSAIELEKIYTQTKIDDFIELCRKTGENKNSLWQDLEKGRETEIDFLNGKVVELARKHGLRVPYNEMLTQLVKAKVTLAKPL